MLMKSYRKKKNKKFKTELITSSILLLTFDIKSYFEVFKAEKSYPEKKTKCNIWIVPCILFYAFLCL